MSELILAIDAGNTDTVLGLCRGQEITDTWRIKTRSYNTPDEWKLVVSTILKESGQLFKNLNRVVLSSVVPAATACMINVFKKQELLLVNRNVVTGLKIMLDNPDELGADRIANAVGAISLYKDNLLIVDFGTATTIDVVSANKEYLGGVITPGIELSSNALFAAAAKLNQVFLSFPDNVLGKNSVNSLKSGIMYGAVSQIEGLIDLLTAELRWEKPAVIATGGLSHLVFAKSKKMIHHEPLLTLKGLLEIHKLNPQ